MGDSDKQRKQESIPVGCIPPADRDTPPPSPNGQRPWEGTWNQAQNPILPRRNMGPGSQTGSDIILRPHPCEQNDWNTPVKILPCPRLRLREVIKVKKWLKDMSTFRKD